MQTGANLDGTMIARAMLAIDFTMHVTGTVSKNGMELQETAIQAGAPGHSWWLVHSIPLQRVDAAHVRGTWDVSGGCPGGILSAGRRTR
jgi:hypothetical protein